ncbi:glycosyltransferase [Opitutus sp. ER46]|uniref:glycosyltransferase family 2 protein n=1 Tax=Opitutus sp. ER46 TaxID=2161864 RepID=UPI000D31DECA|nr:glycosyltransferase [Opitutus sp. ER46]PTX91098.1 hypothetical protein DB354_20905 [Opitutus sp. ER46]
MRLAITIATRNRRELLAQTCAQIARLDPPPDELWICADGCDDDTVAWTRQHAPAAHLIVHPHSRHSIRSRDEMIRAAEVDVIVGLDDDSYPLDLDFVARVKARFSGWSRCAVLSFAQRTDEFPATLMATDFGPTALVGSYVNAASAIRRTVYLELGGVPLEFEHMGDETDFSLRCIAAGWEVVHDPTTVIRHHWTPVARSEWRNHWRHSRNEFWSILLRCPLPWAPFIALRRAVGQFCYACRRGPGWAVREPLWWSAGLAGMPAMMAQRCPVRWPSYRRWLHLMRQPEARVDHGTSRT